MRNCTQHVVKLLAVVALVATSGLHAAKATSQTAAKTITLDYDSSRTLGPLIASIVTQKDIKVSDALRYCHKQLQSGHKAVEASKVIDALPDVLYYLYRSREDTVRAVRENSDKSVGKKQVQLVAPAISALQNVQKSLDSLTKDRSYADAAKALSKALQEFLEDIPTGSPEEILLHLLRVVSPQDGEGIREIIVKVGTTLDSMESKVCVIESKIDALDDASDECCVTVNSKLDQLDLAVEEVFSKVCVVDSKADELFEDFRETWTILDNIDTDLADCCLTINSRLDEVFEDFRETWTAIGDATDLADGDLSELDTLMPAQIDAIEASIISWLKGLAKQINATHP